MSKKREEAPDLLGEILSGKKAARPAAGNPPGSGRYENPRGPRKVKNTFHLSHLAADMLDEYRLILRRLTGSKVSKSEIVEAALRIAFDDVAKNGERSTIAEIIKEWQR